MRHVAAGAITVATLIVLVGCARPSPDLLAVAEDLRAASDPAIGRGLADGDTARRVRAVTALGRIQSAESSPPLVAATSDADPTVRRAALFALGQLGLARGAVPSPVAIDRCRAVAAGTEAGLVADAIEALGKLAPSGVEAMVLAHGAHPEPAVRAEVANALFRRRFVPTWRGEADAPPPLAAESLSWLAAALADPAPVVRRAAAHACSRYGEPLPVAALDLALRDGDEWVRLFATRALARRSSDDGLDSLAAAVRDPSPRVQVEALGGLAAHAGHARIPIESAGARSHHVRAAWARAMASSTVPVAGSAVQGTLRGLLDDRSPTVRGAALDALAALLGSSAGELIRERLVSPDAEDRLAAIRAAGRIGSEAANWLVPRVGDDRRVAPATLETLAAIGAADAALAAALEADDLALRGTAVGVLADLERDDRDRRLAATYEASSGEEWIEVREAIVDALGDGEPATGLLLRACRDDPAGSVRARARVALIARGVEPPPIVEERREPSRLLGRVHDRPRVVLETTRGAVTLELYGADAPLHVALFVELVQGGFYDGLLWHRVVPNFVIQGGDPRGDGWGGSGTLLRDEINRRRFVRGTVGMPKAGKDTGGGQLFVTHVPTPHLDGNYTVFGQVVDGERVLDQIEVGDQIVRARLVD